jgi:hypothetical protein
MCLLWGYWVIPTMESIAIKDVITFGIAAYGAVLSTFNLIQAIRKERRKVVIRQMTAMYGPPLSHIPLMASFEVVNLGHRPVVVSAPTVQVPNGRFMVFVNADGFQNFPKKLEDGESIEMRVQYQVIADGLKRDGFTGIVPLRTSCTDTTGKRFWGERWKLNVDLDWTAFDQLQT